jgi:hypothetical protein
MLDPLSDWRREVFAGLQQTFGQSRLIRFMSTGGYVSEREAVKILTTNLTTKLTTYRKFFSKHQVYQKRKKSRG